MGFAVGCAVSVIFFSLFLFLSVNSVMSAKRLLKLLLAVFAVVDFGAVFGVLSSCVVVVVSGDASVVLVVLLAAVAFSSACFSNASVGVAFGFEGFGVVSFNGGSLVMSFGRAFSNCWEGTGAADIGIGAGGARCIGSVTSLAS